MTELAQRATARGDQHSFDREWWQREARHCGFDWEGLIALHLDVLQRLELIEANVCNCTRPSPKQQRIKPKPRPTPQTTIEAILYCVRERGPNALHEPENVERLRQCDTAAVSQINTRMAKLKENNR
jgi:hypothetical protein